MKINLQAKNVELTPKIKAYVEKKVNTLKKLVSGVEKKNGEVMAHFEVSKTTNHHKTGDVFRADCSINVSGKKFYGSADTADLNQSIDEVVEKLFNEITKNKDKKQTLYKRGATSVKKMMKGLSRRNPQTSKY